MRASVRFLDVSAVRDRSVHRPQEKDPAQADQCLELGKIASGLKDELKPLVRLDAPCLKGIAHCVDAVVPFKQ